MSFENDIDTVKPFALNNKFFESLNSMSYTSSENQSKNSEIERILKSPIQRLTYEIPRCKNPSISQSGSYQHHEDFILGYINDLENDDNLFEFDF